MATTIRPELSEKNPYWIEKHRYYELKHFCLQYPIWQKQYSLISNTRSNEAYSLTPIANQSFYDSTGETAVDRTYYSLRIGENARVLHMWDAETGMIDSWHKYCQKQMRDSFHTLDDRLIFSNTVTTKKDYASKRLSYPLERGDLSAYNRLMSTLYSEEERAKIEWAIGSIVSGESKKLQKFMVLYGSAGTGKSTVLNIIQQLFDGYYSVFDAKALGSSRGIVMLAKNRIIARHIEKKLIFI